MLSDEEKKAINDLNFIIVTDIYDNEVNIDKTKIINEYNKSVGIVLNLIKKQSKEIEELKNKNKKLQDKAKELIFEKQELTSALLDSTPNDKIKAKIEELDEEIKVKREIAKKPMDRVSGRLLTDSIVELEKTKEVLQSLLEKE